MKQLTIIFFLLFIWSCKESAKDEAIARNENPHSEMIRLNQLGYFPNATKIASVIGEEEVGSFSIIDLSTNEEVLNGTVGEKYRAELSGEVIRQFNFSELTAGGTYQISLDNGQNSYPFEIGTHIYDEALNLTAKSYYYQRVSSDISEDHGGKWKRAAGHPDTEVSFHPETGKSGTISSPKGWYDAGDFGKYISNGAFSAGQLLYAIEKYPDLYPDGSLNIPESGNGINDLLDEIKYETDWIATMQDDDGGVFHKLTTKRFSGAIMPEAGTEPRFIMPKSSTATFDFAAFLAKMSRNYKEHDADLAEQWLSQSIRAWKWGIENPDLNFKNPEDVVTGEYGDDDSSQEQFWAAAELYITTGEEEYLDFVVNNLPDLTYTYGDGWKSFMRYLGVFSLLHEDVELPAETRTELENRLLASADDLTKRVQEFDYQQGVNDFQWASNSDVQNIAYVIGEAHGISPKQEYVDAVLSSVNYLFGHNAVGYSMVTGIGDHSPMHVHHRQSEADGIEDPVPGFVCGGPNYHRQDANDVDYPEFVSPMHSYRDVWESYASNEVCLNWNSPTPYVLQFAILHGNN